ncbi:hypothetical protein PG997_000075 [Apiospora hydei]|uniref:Uncharacterized protein n=1 Tax=Apiospora hydei TaxID=1337664 RepID=A0ABR1X9S4_9PEZI
MVNPSSQDGNRYGQNELPQWSSIDNYTSAPLRDDAWSPWVMPIQDEDAAEHAAEVGHSQAVNEEVQREEENQNGA